MNWTKTIPTRPGAYWWKPQNRAIKVVELFLDRYCNLIALGLGVSDEVDLLGGEWCGPLVPVEEVEKAYWEGYEHGLDYLTGRTYTDSRARRVVEGKKI